MSYVSRIKFAVITGGSRGIGYAIARILVSEGCSVILTGRHKKELTEAAARISAALPAGTEARVFGETCDVRDAKAVAALIHHGQAAIPQSRHSGEQRRDHAAGRRGARHLTADVARRR